MTSLKMNIGSMIRRKGRWLLVSLPDSVAYVSVYKITGLSCCQMQESKFRVYLDDMKCKYMVVIVFIGGGYHASLF